MSDEIINDEAVETKVDDVAEQQEAAAPKEDPKPRTRRGRAAKEDEPDNKADEPADEATGEEKVVIHTEGPIYWPQVGKLAKGYNLVSSDVAKKWLDRGYARKATAAEVKRHYGV